MNECSIERLSELNDTHIQELSHVLIDCVEGGASVSFMSPISSDRAVEFWRGVAEAVAAGERALLVAKDEFGICGTVQLILDLPENQPHRAELAKMLVHSRARRQGLGAALMQAAESMARDCGKTLLVLDAVTSGDAARLYERLGWVRVGDVPNFALMPDGAPCSTTYYYRDLNLQVTSGCRDEVSLESSPEVATQAKRTANIPFASDAEIACLVEQFEAATLPYHRWTHRAHLAVGLTYARAMPFTAALDHTRKHINLYNQACGDPNGYNETVTILFLRKIASDYGDPNESRPLRVLVEELIQSCSVEWLHKYYSKDRLWSAEAKACWLEPDRQPLDF